jgi:Flp pilus assembly protein TadG
MAAKISAAKNTSFLSRLRRDQSGNVIAIMAAAVIPVIGLIGGGVDMSRIYLTKTRLQAACDAGALMGRKQMGLGTWAANDEIAKEKAVNMFDMNFDNGAYGTTGRTRSFSESGGAVTGTAAVDVPMTLMRVFDQDARNVSVTCKAELKIPNTDVMFVLDTTGSMAWTASGGNNPTGSDPSRIAGLKTAVKCFYEALAKQNIDNGDLQPSDCGETGNPSTTNGANASIRFGFVPYAINVNAGKLLPLNYIADTWTYQSREPVLKTTTQVSNTPTYGTEGPRNETGRTNTGGSNSSGFTYQDVVVNGVNYDWIHDSTSNGVCTGYTAPSTQTGTGSTGNVTFFSQNPDPVTYPASSVTRTYKQTNTTGTSTSYAYIKASNGNGRNRTYFCALQRTITSSGSTTITYRSTTPVTWSSMNVTEFDGWKYKPVTFNIEGLKNLGTNQWNSTLSLPLGDQGTAKTITWNGCIEERQTHRLTTSTPADEWDPIPSAALDMNIDMAPSTGTAGSFWGPQLPQVLYERYQLNSYGNSLTGTRTLSDVTVSKSNADNTDTMKTVDGYCPTESKLYQAWNADDFKTYVNGLTVGGNTYHDIGLLWGARLASPTGIFSNITSPDGATRERHVIFMTDGDTSAFNGENVVINGTTYSTNPDYNAHGLQWYDRRQSDSSAVPSRSLLHANIDARTQALCKKIRGMPNTTLWVVAYGTTLTAETKANLENCATPGKYIPATSVATLISEFKQIADAISYLRLTV